MTIDLDYQFIRAKVKVYRIRTLTQEQTCRLQLVDVSNNARILSRGIYVFHGTTGYKDWSHQTTVRTWVLVATNRLYLYIFFERWSYVPFRNRL